MRKLIVLSSVGILALLACSKHNPDNVLNPESNLYVGDENASRDENGDGIADVLQLFPGCGNDLKCANDSAVSQAGSQAALSSAAESSSAGSVSASSDATGLSSATMQSSSAASVLPATYTLHIAKGFWKGTLLTDSVTTADKVVKATIDPAAFGLDECFGGWSATMPLQGDSSKLEFVFQMPSANVTITAKTALCADRFMDYRAGDTTSYAYKLIATKNWMMSNVRAEATTGSWCYGDDLAKCATLGRLYSWDAAQNVCPTGWRLPTIEEIRGAKAELALQKAGNREESGSFSQEGSMGFYWTSSPYSTTLQTNATPPDQLNTGNCPNDDGTCGIDFMLNGSDLYAQRDKKILGFSVRCIQGN